MPFAFYYILKKDLTVNKLEMKPPARNFLYVGTVYWLCKTSYSMKSSFIKCLIYIIIIIFELR